MNGPADGIFHRMHQSNAGVGERQTAEGGGEGHTVTGFSIVTVGDSTSKEHADEPNALSGHRIGHRVLSLIDRLAPGRALHELIMIDRTNRLNGVREGID